MAPFPRIFRIFMLRGFVSILCNVYSNNVIFLVGCLQYPEVEHAEVIGPRRTYGIDEIARFACNEGFVTYGDISISCGEDGRFSEPKFQCLGQDKNLELTFCFILLAIQF